MATKAKKVKTAKVPKAPKAQPTNILLKKDCVYKLGAKKLTEDMKISPQAKAILSILEESGPITRENLLTQMESKVKTNQPVVKILSFYQANLKAEGLLDFEHPHRD